MIIAVIAMGVMQAALYQIVKMVPMRNCLMSATGAMGMGLMMSARWMLDGAPVGVGGIDFEYMLVHMVAVNMV
jgi:hypothetical protein